LKIFRKRYKRLLHLCSRAHGLWRAAGSGRDANCDGKCMGERHEGISGSACRITS